ncbi:MAG: cell division protein FtsA [Candidatus Latescibacteria bacterium]|nr:cell division protein FtsA [Candidatus Latescibacterota bacterium]
MQLPRSNLVVGLDIGTTKICAIVAEQNGSPDGELKIVGVGTSSSEGLRRGVVVNVEKTVESIRRAIGEAELMAGVKISSVYAGIAGDHIRSINGRGVIAVSGEENEIDDSDVRRVIDAAKAIAIPIDREIIHVLPQEYIVDDQPGIKDPVGMSGIRLEAEVHIVTGAVTSAQNIVKSVRRAGIDVADIVLEPLAASNAVLSSDEKELGVALIDIGGGTTDIAIFFEGSVRHTAVIGLGGQNVTNDIAIGLRTPWNQAERIKQQYGCALVNMVGDKEVISVSGVGGRPPHDVPRRVVAEIIEPRMAELLGLALREIRKTDYADLLGAGIVLTGGGSVLTGTIELAEQIFDMPVRHGIPEGITGLVNEVSSPIYATGVGLVQFGTENRHVDMSNVSDSDKLFDTIIDRMKSWFREFF